jgi:hypothetical protein
MIAARSGAYVAPDGQMECFSKPSNARNSLSIIATLPGATSPPERDDVARLVQYQRIDAEPHVQFGETRYGRLVTQCTQPLTNHRMLAMS